MVSLCQSAQTVLHQTLGQMATVLAAPLLTPACTAFDPRLIGKVVWQVPQTAMRQTLRSNCQHAWQKASLHCIKS